MRSVESRLHMIPQDPLDRAVAALRDGRPDDARAILAEVLARHPRHAQALHLLGVVVLEAGDPREAVRHLARAVEIAPKVAHAWSNLGVAHAASGDFDAAVRAHERALRIDPALAGAYRNRAIALQRLGRHEESLSSARQAVSRGASDAEAWMALGDALVSLRREREAVAAYDRAVALAPRLALAVHNRGTARYRIGDAEAAARDFRGALEIAPAFARAHESLALVLCDLGRPDEALAAAERAVELDPAQPACLVARGLCLDLLGRSDAALDDFDAALRFAPDYAPAWSHRAVALGALGRDEEARASHRRAYEADPRDAHSLVHRLHLRRKFCDGRGDALLAERIRELAAAGASCPPFALLHVPATPALQRGCAERHAREALPPPAARAPAPRGAGQRIHVGYFSADFHGHPVMQIVAPLLEHHDRARFEVSAFSLGAASTDPMSARVRSACDRFEEVGALSDADIAARARALRLDIAIDLMGYTEGARPAVFAYRAAPVQAQYLGFPGTMGTPAMDVLIADGRVVPIGEEVHYVEQVVRLPHSYQANDRARRSPLPVPPRPALGLPAAGTIFACFNDRLKITPEAFSAWMRILAGVEGSVLWLVDGGARACANLQEAASAARVDPARLVFAPRVPLPDHLARVPAADLALDTFPYNGHATTSDTLLGGVPVVALRGTTFAGRVAESLLCAIGLPELVAASLADYETLAIRLGRDAGARSALRAKVAAHREREPLFDIAGFTQALECAYEAMVATP